jgi:stage V sporulation protein AF
MIDGLKLASLNTPNMLNNSLSVVGGLILVDYAVQAGWFSPQTILYMAIVAIAAFTQQSYELGYAFKFLRMLLLALTAIFDVWGYVAGLALLPILLVSNKTLNGENSYLYPLIPFNAKALRSLLFRMPIDTSKN